MISSDIIDNIEEIYKKCMLKKIFIILIMIHNSWQNIEGVLKRSKPTAKKNFDKKEHNPRKKGTTPKTKKV